MIINVKVIPNAHTESIIFHSDNTLSVKVRAPAIEGKANTRVVAILAEHFNVPKRRVLIKNPLSRKKIIEIVGLSQI